MPASPIPFENPKVAAKFAGYTGPQAERMLQLRRWVFECAEELDLKLQESLRWGEPAYLCPQGTTLRMDAKNEAVCSLFVHCQTDLIAQIRARHGDTLSLVGTREVQLLLSEALPEQAVRDCIALTLIYKLRKSA